MSFSCALSTASSAEQAVKETCSKALEELGGKPDLALAFFSPHHASDADDLAASFAKNLGTQALLGCQGESIVANDREIEDGPALALWLARWPENSQQYPFHLNLEETSDGYSLVGWPDELQSADAASAMLLLADPYTFPIDECLQQLHEISPALRVLGGMSSGAAGPGEAALLHGSQVQRQGAVGVLLKGGPRIRSVVSQGCRPIGKHMIVTKARDNVILELGGKPALMRLQEVWQELSPKEQTLVRQGLHIGRVLSEYKGDFQRGDFLVRNVMGFDNENGGIAITERVRVGQTVQFHVRDAATADEDLHELLQLDVNANEKRPAAALLFTCNGRGTRLFETPHHDAGVVQEEAGRIPVAGFFAQGELGPVGGQNFIHGFTASIALFEE